MALSLILRNATKLNGAASLKNAGLCSLKNYTTNVLSQPNTSRLVNKVTPAVRSIYVSAPKLAASGTNYTPLWRAERIVSAALLATIPAAFIYPSQALDALMAVSVILHTHWGVEALVVDYARPRLVGNAVAKLMHGSLYIVSVVSLGGLFYLIYNDIGIAKTIQQLWAVKGE